MILCGTGEPGPGLQVNRWLCPWCQGTGRWGDGGERCMECGSAGVVDEPTPGMDMTSNECAEEPAVRIARPPAVMAAPCADCAFRPGSPEELGQAVLTERPFHCHHGLTRVEEGYVVPAYVDGRPLGAMICAGWWQLAVEGKAAPRTSWYDPGGSDRSPSAPRTSL